MKITHILLISCFVALACAVAQPRGKADDACATQADDSNSLDGRLCRTTGDIKVTTKTEVIYHTGKHGDHAADIKAGDLLNDKIQELELAASSAADAAFNNREILLKCKVPGCTFNLAASVRVTQPFKIRGELKHGQRPNILLSSPFYIGDATPDHPQLDSNGNADFAMESVNIIGPGKQAQSHIVIQGDLNTTPSCFILFDKVAFKNHHVGFSNGGAIEIQGGFGAKACKVDIINSRFINNSAKFGGAIHSTREFGEAGVHIANTHFIGNAAIEAGGALYLEDKEQAATDLCLLVTDGAGVAQVDDRYSFAGVHFKDNTANKKGDTFVGRGGAIFAENVALQIRDSRTHGGNTAKFGNLIYADNSCVGLLRFGCYEGPFSHVLNNNGYEGYGDYYSAYPVCSASSYDTYALKEDIYARANTGILIEGVDLPGGVTCEERSTASTVTRHGCGSHIYAYHCLYGDEDHYVEAEDYDRDGFDCRYDCNDLWKTVNPAAGEQCNTTVELSTLRDHGANGGSVIYAQAGVPLDSNCNGLHNEWVDMDGDHVPDWYDQCPHDYWKISPGKCGCGYEDTEGCVQTGGSSECTTVEDAGVWYYMCEGNWWYWGDNDWTYGGAY